MKSTNKYILTFIILLLGVQLNAQVRRDRAEKIITKSEIATSKDQLQQDIIELEKFRTNINQLQAAWKSGNKNKIETLQEKLLVDMKREIRQSQLKTKASQREVNRSEREIKNSRKDQLESRRDMASRHDSRLDDIKDLRDDRRDTKDDLRDLNDDKRDLATQSNRYKTQIEIKNNYATQVYVKNAPANNEISIKIKLLHLFAQTLEDDIVATKKEISEDKTELIEDRHELYEDRRERRERK